MKTALITGAGRQNGLGFETAKQLGQQGYRVIIAARQTAQVTARVDELTQQGLTADGVQLDITDTTSIQQAAMTIHDRYGRLDVLINNAATFGQFDSILATDIDEAQAEFKTNFFGPWQVAQAFYPLLANSEAPRIVNVSSGAGSFQDPVYGMLDGSLGMPVSTYALTKLALNGLTIKMAKEFAADHILVNAVCPDVIATHQAPSGFARPVSEGGKSVVWAATLPDDGPTGGFFRDGQALLW